MSGFVLTDAAIERALAPSVEVGPPPDFSQRLAVAIAEQPRRSRLSLPDWLAWPRQSPQVAQVLLLILLLLTLVAVAIVFANVSRKGPSNGHLIVSTGSELVDIDPDSAVPTTLLTRPGRIYGVGRSDDGSLISFWTDIPVVNALEIVAGNGANERRVALNLIPAPTGGDQIDVWSPDQQSLAAGVVAVGDYRIMVVDVTTGTGQLIGPPGASNPLWSPDGRLLAFSYLRLGTSVLAVMRPDGLGLSEISGDLGEFDVDGANNWSPDNAWVYFGAHRKGEDESRIYRANVAGLYSDQLTTETFSAAPALSPDGTTVVYVNWPPGFQTQNLKIMAADGSDPHLLLESAANDGWSNDGRFVLAEWRPPSGPYELVTIRPDGTDLQTLMSFPDRCATICVRDFGWGQPRSLNPCPASLAVDLSGLCAPIGGHGPHG